MSPSSPARRRSASRLARLLPQPQNPPNQNGTVAEASSIGIPAHVDDRPYGMQFPRHESSPSAVSYSSWSSQKTPARSYYQRSFHGSLAATDAAHNASQSVREETAELAAWALSGAASILSGTSPARQHTFSSTPTTTATNIDSSLGANSDSEAFTGRESHDSSRPDAIQEVSESDSGGTTPPSQRSPVTSVLTEMIRASPPTEDELGPTGGDNSRNGSLPGETQDDGCTFQASERTPLIQKGPASESVRSLPSTRMRDLESQKSPRRRAFSTVRKALTRPKEHALVVVRRATNPKSWDKKSIWEHGVLQPARYLPAVILGLLLNILDALSYGMILFPLGQPIFESLGTDGISMFYVSCIVSQLVYSLGGSVFRGGVGSEMIEVVPFFHKMAFTIVGRVGENNAKAVLATTILSYSMSSVLTGLVFFIMGSCKIGFLIGFFPRHILIGCIGGVGWFLVATGLEVSAKLDGNLEYTLAALKSMIKPDTLFLWLIPLLLAIVLLAIQRWNKHPLLLPTYFSGIPAIFYFFVAAIPDLSVSQLRDKGWIFAAPEAGVPFYHFYELYDFNAVDWKALGATIPAMFALTFFGILHVPINVPALGLSVGEDHVDVDRELRAHGYSNVLSGICGSIQNYLVYTNSLLFIRSGGNSRVAGFMLAIGTFGILVAGPVIVGYIPIMVVGALIFTLGIDLMREALVDPWGKVHRLEYLTILIIVVTMGAYDFVVGILVGIVLACVSYVLQTSQVSAIRSTLSGNFASSTVRRHPIQHRFLEDVGQQIFVVKLAGYLFFGTIVGVENRIRALLGDTFQAQPVRFLVLDLANVHGVDFSAAEAFSRIGRVLNGKNVELIMCGITVDTEVGKSLSNVGIFNADGVQLFEDLNSALEYCENELLKAFYQQSDALTQAEGGSEQLGEYHRHDHHQSDIRAVVNWSVDVRKHASNSFSQETMSDSPRRLQLREVANATLHDENVVPPTKWQQHEQPLSLIMQTFSNLSTKDEDFWSRAAPFFEREEHSAGTVLYHRGDSSDGFYLLEVGILKAEYILPQGQFSELIVAGTTCGELPFFSDTNRSATTTAERHCVAWILNRDKWEDLQKKQPDAAQELLTISLKLTSERMDAVTKYILMTSG